MESLLEMQKHSIVVAEYWTELPKKEGEKLTGILRSMNGLEKEATGISLPLTKVRFSFSNWGTLSCFDSANYFLSSKEQYCRKTFCYRNN